MLPFLFTPSPTYTITIDALFAIVYKRLFFLHVYKPFVFYHRSSLYLSRYFYEKTHSNVPPSRRICHTRTSTGMKRASCAPSAASRWSTSSSAPSWTRSTAATVTMPSSRRAAMAAARSSVPVSSYHMLQTKAFAPGDLYSV